MLTFLKLGGSLITDKNHAQTVRADVLARLADEIASALTARPDLRLLVGHGSGSFGHSEAKKYGTKRGVKTPEQWRQFAEVAHVAAKLNRHVIDALRAAGIPAINALPSASVVCRDSVIVSMAVTPIQTAVENSLVPVVMGDVAVDEVRGGTIISTEDEFRYLAQFLHPNAILLSGIERGVLTRWPDGDVISLVNSANIDEIRSVLRGSHAADVTGGMESKVLEMLAQAQAMPGLTIRIFSGVEPGSVKKALLGQSEEGTVVRG
ncbi:MAG TPA: isopentenyl phosphate kinase [Anaerolineales bacterium]|nr:isopentenyl phosphate kinase [Anaerolineales bacterium]HLB49116.1 isopentenyl phosphate kinase [Anaerolineales bacterium]